MKKRIKENTKITLTVRQLKKLVKESRDRLGTITLDELKHDIAWLDEKKCGCCHHLVARTDGGTELCIVVGWLDGFDEAEKGTPLTDGTWRICAKVAYQHSNNAMQCDFDVDWLMPYNPDTGDVDDTCEEVDGTQFEVDWLNRQARRIWNEWKDELDDLD